MKILQMTARILATIGVLTLLVVFAGEQAAPVLSANVPFDFSAGGAVLPAGTYQFEIHRTEQFLMIRSPKGGETKLQIITQLGGASLFKDTGLVFDKVQGQHVLSEVWIPGEGGVLVNATQKTPNYERVLAVVSGTGPNLSGKEVFNRTCVRCHGPEGKGNAMADKFFQTPVPRLDSALVQKKSDQELRDIISHGKRQMDPVRVREEAMQHLLDPASVDAVIRYVRTLKHS